MRPRTWLILAVVGALAAVVYVQKRGTEGGVERFSFQDIDTQQTDTITVTGAMPVTLVKKPSGTWHIAGDMRADAQAVDTVLRLVPMMESDHMVTRNPEDWASMELDDATGTKIVLSAGQKVQASFLIGQTRNRAALVRVDERVFKVPNVHKSMFHRPLAVWRNRQIFADEAGSVERLEVQGKDFAGYTLVRSDKGWAFEAGTPTEGNFRFDTDAADALIKTLVSLQASRVLEEDPGNKVTGLEQPRRVLTYQLRETEGGPLQTRSLTIGQPKPDDPRSVFGAASTHRSPLLIATDLARTLLQAASDLRDLSLMTLDAEAVQKLEITEGKRRLVLEHKDDTWQLVEAVPPAPEGYLLDSSLVFRHVQVLAAARALAFIKNVSAREAGLDAPTAIVKATLNDGQAFTLRYGKQTEYGGRQVVYCQGSAPGVYVVAPWHPKHVAVGLQKLAAKGTPSG